MAKTHDKQYEGRYWYPLLRGGGSESNRVNYKGYYHPIKLVPSKMERTTEYFSFKRTAGQSDSSSRNCSPSKIHSGGFPEIPCINYTVVSNVDVQTTV